MLTDERPEIALPDRLAGMIERGQNVVVGFVPDHVEALGIHRRCGRSESIIIVDSEWLQAKLAFPHDRALLRVYAKNGDATSLARRTGQKKPLTPKNGRGMTLARQRQ